MQAAFSSRRSAPAAILAAAIIASLAACSSAPHVPVNSDALRLDGPVVQRVCGMASTTNQPVAAHAVMPAGGSPESLEIQVRDVLQLAVNLGKFILGQRAAAGQGTSGSPVLPATADAPCLALLGPIDLQHLKPTDVIRIRFEAAPGSTIDPRSLKIEGLKGPFRKDLMPTVMRLGQVSERGLALPLAELPGGSGQVSIHLTDSRQRPVEFQTAVHIGT